MAARGSIKQALDEAAAIIRMQTARIAELEAEVEQLKRLDAHGTLRSIYSDPGAPRSDRIKAASASLAREAETDAGTGARGSGR